MTLAGGALRQLADVVKGKAKLKFNLIAGSYDTQLAFYGLTNLTFGGPGFLRPAQLCSQHGVELFIEADATTFPANPEQDLRVRFLFKNGTTDNDLTPFPLFGQSGLYLFKTNFVLNFT
jgi:prostatic aicd phosphatase